MKLVAALRRPALVRTLQFVPVLFSLQARTLQRIPLPFYSLGADSAARSTTALKRLYKRYMRRCAARDAIFISFLSEQLQKHNGAVAFLFDEGEMFNPMSRLTQTQLRP